MSKKRKPRFKRIVTLLLSVILVVAGLCGGAYLWYTNGLKPTGKADEVVTVKVSENETYSDLLSRLASEGLIKNETAAKLYAKFHTTMSYAGEFKVNKGMSTPEILEYLSNQGHIEQTYQVVTIPEGYWAKQIASVLAEKFPEYTAQSFIDLWNNQSYIEELAKTYTFLDPKTLDDSNYFVKLEGYLYPETYHIDKGSSQDTITRVFLDQFNKVYQELKSKIEKSEFNLEQILTLASIVQFESGSPKIMPEIARVFLNRLDKGMMLQSSVTVCYALYDDFKSAQDCETNPNIDSPYNTYKYSGLPIGPILNPDKNAIEAVLNPADNDYLYFVADIYGDGSVHFARTLEEHEANVDKYNLRIQ